MKLHLFCDGGSRGNPGPSAYGFVLYDAAGNLLEKCGNYLGITTNNQAEYQGLIDGLKLILAKYQDASVQITMDSLLVVNQVKGAYKVKNLGLKPLHTEVLSLLSKLSSWSIHHTLRGGNSLADSLVNQALDQASL